MSLFFTTHVGNAFLAEVSHRRLYPARGAPLARVAMPRILSFNLTTREGQGSGTKGALCERMYRLVACFRSGELTRSSALFALSFQHCRRESGERRIVTIALTLSDALGRSK